MISNMDRVDMVVTGGKSHVAYAKEEAGGLRMVLDGQT